MAAKTIIFPERVTAPMVKLRTQNVISRVWSQFVVLLTSAIEPLDITFVQSCVRVYSLSNQAKDSDNNHILNVSLHRGKCPTFVAKVFM